MDSTLTVGITGHRFLARTQEILRGIDRALDWIEDWRPGWDWTVISPLAQGSDQLFVRRVLERRAARLIVPLPMPPREYLADFTTQAARKGFYRLLDRADKVIAMPPCASRAEAYASAGRFIIDNSVVIVAVWDGRASQGPGGTGEVVGWARERGLPLAWVLAGNRQPGARRVTDLGEMQGQVRFESFSEID